MTVPNLLIYMPACRSRDVLCESFAFARCVISKAVPIVCCQLLPQPCFLLPCPQVTYQVVPVPSSVSTQCCRNGSAVEGIEDPAAAPWKQASFNFYDKRVLGGAWEQEARPAVLKEFFRVLAVCHTVIPDGRLLFSCLSALDIVSHRACHAARLQYLVCHMYAWYTVIVC